MYKKRAEYRRHRCMLCGRNDILEGRAVEMPDPDMVAGGMGYDPCKYSDHMLMGGKLLEKTDARWDHGFDRAGSWYGSRERAEGAASIEGTAVCQYCLVSDAHEHIVAYLRKQGLLK